MNRYSGWSRWRLTPGMRQGEIFDLTWFDVDLPRGVIHIRITKNGKDRFGPSNQTVRAVLEGLPHQRACLSESNDEGTFGRREATI